MTESDPQYQRLSELAALPPTDPARQELEAELESLDPAQRRYWRNITDETDRLHEAMSRMRLPPCLQDKLLRLPDESPAPRFSLLQGGLKTWAAAAALVAISICAYTLWLARPQVAMPLPAELALDITRQAVHYHESPPALEVAGNDGNQIENALDAHKALPFPVVVLQPRDKMSLLGGGMCDLSGTPAAFTRWQLNGANYTLYQFDGKKLGVPSQFLTTTEAPPDLSHDAYHYRVILWPGFGGKCTWALVLESDSATDEFSRGAY